MYAYGVRDAVLKLCPSIIYLTDKSHSKFFAFLI